MTKLVRGMKLLEDMYSLGVCTGEIETQTQRRREQMDRITKDCKEKEQENERHRMRILKIRVGEAREDWIVARNKYRMEKARMRNLARSEIEVNRLKHAFEWIDAETLDCMTALERSTAQNWST